MTTKNAALTLQKKIEIIAAVERNDKLKTTTKTKIAESFHIPKTTLSTIIRNKIRITEAFEQSKFEPGRKRLRTAAHEDLEDALIKWISQARSLNTPLSGSLLLEKADCLAQKLGYSTFKCSNGWLERFKIRHNITFKKVYGESARVTSEMATEWTLTVLPTLLSEYSPDNVFNADETGIFYKCLPDKTFLMKGESCRGGKLSKERLTVLVAANMSGTEKLPLLVIGKFAKPRCFKGVQTLPVQYEANMRAWMLSDLFTAWLTKLDKKFLQQARSVLMIVDNCPSHLNIQPQLKAIRLVFLPPNATSILQPCDQGIIRNLKVHYRHLLLQKMVLAIDNKEVFSVNVLDALRMLKSAWSKVKQQTIANCFRHAGFIDQSQECGESHMEMIETTPESDIPDIEGITHDVLPQGVSFEDYLSVDDAILTEDIMTDDDIIESLTPVNVSTDEFEFEQDDSPCPPDVPTPSEAIQAMKVIQRYIESLPNADTTLDFFTQFEDKVTGVVLASKKTDSYN